jgi:predicted nucleic acid-binding protein
MSDKPKAYIETSVVSYLTAKPARDIIIAANQRITHEWWRRASSRFQLVTSALVLKEAGFGDVVAAEDRLRILEFIDTIEAKDSAKQLMTLLVSEGAVPPKAVEDALHIAIAVTNGVEYLVTWNCRHIANATLQSRIQQICRDAGYEPTVICTPADLMEQKYDF